MVSIEHLASGWRLQFNAYDALDRVDKTDKNMLKVAYSKEWSSSRYVLKQLRGRYSKFSSGKRHMKESRR